MKIGINSIRKIIDCVVNPYVFIIAINDDNIVIPASIFSPIDTKNKFDIEFLLTINLKYNIPKK